MIVGHFHNLSVLRIIFQIKFRTNANKKENEKSKVPKKIEIVQGTQ